MYSKIQKLILPILICCSFQIYTHEYCSTSSKKVLVFDFGGVIGHFKKDPIYTNISQTFGIPLDEIKGLLTNYKTYLFAGGEEKLFWEEIAREQGRKLPSTWLVDFRNVLASAIKEIPGTLALIKDLKKQGYQIALLSNVRKDKAEVYKSLGYYSYFDPILLSCDLGMTKPDPNIFHALLQRLQVPKTECLFIDDRIENITAARTLGIDSIQFIDCSQLSDALAKRGIYTNTI